MCALKGRYPTSLITGARTEGGLRMKSRITSSRFRKLSTGECNQFVTWEIERFLGPGSMPFCGICRVGGGGIRKKKGQVSAGVTRPEKRHPI